MTYEQAAYILKHKASTIHDQVAAAAFINSYYREQNGQPPVTPVAVRFRDATLDPTDPNGAPSTTGGRNVHIHLHGLINDDGELVEAGRQGTNGAQENKGRAGSKLVQRLSGPVSSYFIAADGDGTACLYRTVDADNAMDPGAISIKSKPLTGDQRLATARDARRSFSLLRGINAKNAEFWSNQGS